VASARIARTSAHVARIARRQAVVASSVTNVTLPTGRIPFAIGARIHARYVAQDIHEDSVEHVAAARGP